MRDRKERDKMGRQIIRLNHKFKVSIGTKLRRGRNSVVQGVTIFIFERGRVHATELVILRQTNVPRSGQGGRRAIRGEGLVEIIDKN